MGHSNIVIKAKDKITIDNVGFAVDICITAACAGLIHLESENDIIIKSVSVGTNDESGIGSFNTLKVKGKNFYAGKVEAISLATALNNSYLDLSEVSGTTFIDDFHIRTGTLKAKNFHINNFSVRKSNSHSVVTENIGKSFINYLSMEIGTSDTADGADIRFNGGDILNLNLIDARATSHIYMENIKNVNVNQLNIKEADLNIKNGIFNTIVSTKGQTVITNGASKIIANALNVNELLHIKDSSKHSGVMNIVLNKNEEVTQDFSNYLNVNVDSKDLKNMSKEEIEKLIESNKNQNGNNGKTESDYKNASGTYITTSA